MRSVMVGLAYIEVAEGSTCEAGVFKANEAQPHLAQVQIPQIGVTKVGFVEHNYGRVPID